MRDPKNPYSNAYSFQAREYDRAYEYRMAEQKAQAEASHALMIQSLSAPVRHYAPAPVREYYPVFASPHEFGVRPPVGSPEKYRPIAVEWQRPKKKKHSLSRASFWIGCAMLFIYVIS